MKKSITALLLAVVCLFTAACADQPVPTEPVDTTAGISTQAPTTEATVPTETTQPPILDVPWMKLPGDRTVTAGQYFVYSCETGEFLLASPETDTKVYPASATKLFTAYVALQYLPVNHTITAGKVLDMVPAEASVAGIRKKDAMTVESLIAAMLMSDGNDAAWILAEAAGRMMYGSSSEKVSTTNALKRFVEEMNTQAKLLGMNDTNFDNPGGIHSENHYSTGHDLAIMAMAALEDPVILRFGSADGFNIPVAEGELALTTVNELLKSDSQYFCEACVGLMAGENPETGSYLLAAFEYMGRTLVVGVFDCPKAEDRFPDALQLLNKALGIS